MKTTIIALVALIAAAPAVLAQNVSNKLPHQRHQASRTHARVVSAGYAPRQAMHAKSYPGAFGYPPNVSKDYFYESSKNAGGGGSGM